METLIEKTQKLSITNSNEVEINEIENILNDIANTIKFDDIFCFTNSGISYKIGNDSKIISKIYECILIEKIKEILPSHNFKYEENSIQNKYPDFIIQSNTQKDKYYAIDIKSTYLKTPSTINGFTLGTYKGYFRNRNSLTSIVKCYDKFIKHYCLCVIYKRDKNKIPVKHVLLREKWQIASNNPGSGNTCNIGSTKLLYDLIQKNYYFKNEQEFNEYWLIFKC